MFYCEITDVLKVCSEFEDTDFEPVIERCIGEATNRINGDLCQRYSVPFSAPFPPAIVDICATLAASLVSRDQMVKADLSKQAIELEDVYNSRIRALQSGKESLPGIPVAIRMYATGNEPLPGTAPLVPYYPPGSSVGIPVPDPSDPLSGWRW